VLQSEIEPDLLEALNTWFSTITANSAVAEELANENVAVEEVPANAQAALEATEVPELTLGGILQDCLDAPIECVPK
jgi:hypothetical protein